jgi:hypothetical protein
MRYGIGDCPSRARALPVRQELERIALAALRKGYITLTITERDQFV